MILSEFKDFPSSGVIIALDWGRQRMGVAVSSPDWQFTFARDAIVGVPDMAAAAANAAHNAHAVGIVVGLPLRSDGSESDTTKMVRQFAAALSENTDLPIVLIDESFTSHSAAADMPSRNPRGEKTKLDCESARLILENALAMRRRMAD